jgi:CHASE2 domain-containing sensor protein
MRTEFFEFLRGRRRVFLQASAVAALALIASTLLARSEFGRVIDEKILDLFIKNEEPLVENGLILVDINDDDFEKIFQGRRPLDPGKIGALVKAAAQGGSKLVAIDIDTEDWPPGAWQEVAKGLELPDNFALVWARDSNLEESPEGDRLVPEPLLGDKSPNLQQNCSGYPFLGEQAGIVRWFYLSSVVDGRLAPSFVAQIEHKLSQKRSQSDCLTQASDERRYVINFSYRLPKVPASALFDPDKVLGWAGDAVVIIGGSFHQSGDRKHTPLGMRSGLQINGLALATLMNRQSRELKYELGEQWAVLIDVLFAALLVFCAVLSSRLAFWATPPALAGAVALSFWLSSNLCS